LRRRLALGALLITLSLSTAARGDAVSPSLNKFASFGASMGFMKWVFDVDVAEGARVKPMLKGVFRYRFNQTWVLVGESGFGWNDYEEPENTVSTVFPTTMSLYRRIREPFGVALYLGAGPGVYFWDHKRKGKTFRDPWTDNFQKGWEPGLALTLEAERQFWPQITLTLTVQNHYLFSTGKDDLPAAFGDDDDFLDARLGVNFHWSPTQGIILGTPEAPEPAAPTQ
jgi:hypothetical protein